MIRLKNSIAADVVIVVFLVILLAGACILRWTPTERLEYKAYDAISALKDKTPASNVVIIGIDNNSIAAIGRLRNHGHRGCHSPFRKGPRPGS